MSEGGGPRADAVVRPGPASPLGPDDDSQLLARHSELLQQMASGAPLSTLLDGVTGALERLIAGARCSILLLSRDGRTLHHGAAPSLPAAYSARIDGMPVGPAAGSCGTAAHGGARTVAADIAVDPRWTDYRALALPHGLRSCWSTPILGASDQVIGTFAVYHDEPHRPDQRELQLVDRFTYLAAVAVEHAALYGALADSEEQFRRAFEDNAVAMALVGLDGRLRRTNAALGSLLHRAAGDLTDVPLVSILDAGSVAPWRAGWTSVVSGAAESRALTVDLAVDEERRATVLATISMVRSHDDVGRYVSLNALDITAQLAAEGDRAARREAEVARSTAEAASSAKSDFLTSFSHELRSPLQAITGFTELFETLDLDDARRREALGHIRGACSHLLAMVDDVLDISRIEAGTVPVTIEDVRVGPIAREVVTLLAPLAARRTIRLDADAASLAVEVRADVRRLRQVLINLVTNAVRYGADGGSTVVRCQPGPAVGEVTILVQDDGPGIPPDLMDRLFVPFDTLGAEPAGDGVGPGVGVGLIVAQGLCGAMGGWLSLTSGAGTGTTARVTLPAVPLLA